MVNRCRRIVLLDTQWNQIFVEFDWCSTMFSEWLACSLWQITAEEKDDMEKGQEYEIDGEKWNPQITEGERWVVISLCLKKNRLLICNEFTWWEQRQVNQQSQWDNILVAEIYSVGTGKLSNMSVCIMYCLN